MKHAVSWLSLLATVFGLVTTSDGSLINRAPALPAEQEDGLTVTVGVGVTLWLGGGESCTAETITETSTQTGNVSPGATTITITEATTKSISGCRSGPTLSVIADVGIGPVDVSANAALALPGHGPIKTVTDYTTLTRTSCSCTDDSTVTPTTSTVPVTTTSSVPGSTSSTVPGTTSSSVPPITTSSSPGTTTPTTSMTSDDSTTTPTETPTPTTTTVTTRTTSSSESVTTLPVSTTSVTTTGDSTVTVPNTTVTLPGTTIPETTITTVVTEPATTVTISDGSNTLPGSTLTTTVTGPGSTVTVGDSTTITATVTGPGTTSTQTSSSTTTVSASVCSSLISNPSYTPPAVLPDDYTWGCAPGYLCKPRHTGDRSECNVEAGLPDPGYVCSPSDCIVAPPLDVHPSWQYNVSKIYYNLNPEDFGLNYSIFQSSEDPVAASSKRDMSLWDFAVAQKMKRADITNIPTVCFNDCNDAALEPQTLGKTPELCESDSAFMENLDVCEQCITNNAESDSNQYSSQMLPTFAQWLNFCSDMVTSTTGESATSTEATSTTTTGTEERSSPVETTQPVTPITTSVSGSLVTTSFSGSVVTISTSGSLVTSSVPGSIATTSVSGVRITTSLPGSIKTVSSTQGTGGDDENTSDNASGIPSSSVHVSPTSSATPSTSSPAFNAAGSISIPHIGLMSLLWAAFAPLL
ncbi:hypothetical protein PENFLA_c005G05712 [Penicillium flavigenum]|uniref:Ig-like domain-containing protein n=1 Tax=Penicillium flavigenum TaxID=254877 RepID=A0A1V6TQ01_9EURO|nr:hypothetical protein PENFLA_c005G05712 [Penicillium flavigenum]